MMGNELTARIITGDCLQVLRDLPSHSIDAVITDPPYCSGGFQETAKQQATCQGVVDKKGWFANDNMTTPGLVFLLRAILVEARRLLRPNRSALLFTDWRMVPSLAPALESSGMRYRNMVVWDKGSSGLGGGFRPRHEIILEYCNGATEYQFHGGGNIIRCNRVPGNAKVHPTEKPVDLLRQLIRVVVPEGGCVLDPFAGSGTTGVAAVQEGRSFIGIELEPRYAEMVQRRLDELARPELSHDPQQPSLWSTEDVGEVQDSCD